MSKRMTNLLVAMLLPSIASAGNDDAKIAVHLQAYSKKAICTLAPTPPCNSGESNLVVQGSIGVGYNAYFLVADGDSSVGLAGAVFGITYNAGTGSGVDAFGWQLCADKEFTGNDWPEPGSGNLIVWNSETNCQTSAAAGDSDGGITAVLGALYVYAYGADTLLVTPRDYVPQEDFGVADCEATESLLPYPDNGGRATFGVSGGKDPCNY
jgi:hypothetical protein